MSRQGFLSGAACHIEYHTVDRKREKASNCIFLDEERMCSCPKSTRYLEKCFEATHCPYRKQEKKKEKVAKPYTSKHFDSPKKITQNAPKKPVRQAIKCAIPIGTTLIHSSNGPGRFIQYNRAYSTMLIRFAKGQGWYQYPEAFEEGHLKIASVPHEEQVPIRRKPAETQIPVRKPTEEIVRQKVFPSAKQHKYTIKTLKIIISGRYHGEYTLKPVITELDSLEDQTLSKMTLIVIHKGIKCHIGVSVSLIKNIICIQRDNYETFKSIFTVTDQLELRAV